MGDQVRVRVVDEKGAVIHRLEGDAGVVQRDLDTEEWRASVTTEREVFIQIHLGGGDWVTFDTRTLDAAP